MTYHLTYPDLGARQKTVFGALLKEYISTARAVGSSFLARRIRLGLSPATIRNVMAELEEMGFLKRSHKSAGRIPTDFGYAYYVDSLMEKEDLPGGERRIIITALNEAATGGVREILKKTSVALSRISMLFSVVLAPNILYSTLLKIDLVRMSANKMLVILSINEGLVHSLMLEIDPQVKEDDLSKLNTVVNERLSGLKLSEVKASIRHRLSGITGASWSIANRLVEAADELFPEKGISTVHLGETSHIMVQPEFTDTNRMRGLFKALDDPDIIVRLFEDADHEPVEGIRIGIGSELKVANLQGCSVVATRYNIGEMEGSLGVIGPTRMPYSRLASLLNFTSWAMQRKMVE